LITELLAHGHDVVPASNSSAPPDDGLAWQVFDIRDRSAVLDAMDLSNPDAVVHLAAQASVPMSWEDPAQTFTTNVVGTSNVVTSLADGVRLLLVGSAQVYGELDPGRPLLETDDLQPLSPYAVSKAAQEAIGVMYSKERGTQIVMTRSFNHMGPGQSADYVVGRFASQLAGLGPDGGTLRVGRLDPVRDFLDVRDVVRAYRLLVEDGPAGEIYNVCSGSGVEIREIMGRLIEAAGLTGLVQVEEDRDPRPGDPSRLIGDNSKLRAAVGWEARFSLDDSLRETLEWNRSATKGKVG
jgi:GDP-4-dehydro-6-deoxy-D-mannose reductase